MVDETNHLAHEFDPFPIFCQQASDYINVYVFLLFYMKFSFRFVLLLC